jgi:transcriptional regulator GlxA family with amidase domain
MLYEDMFTVSFLAFDSVQALDVCGPTEVFATANELSGTEHSRTRVLSPDGQVFRATNGLRWVADGAWSDLSTGDILIVPGGDGVHALRSDEAIARLTALAGRAGCIASVCTGSYLLAEAGILDDKCASTHWSKEDDFSSAFTEVTLDRDALYQLDEGSIEVWTSAGVTAGMDMALAMVEDDISPELAYDVAQWLVLSFRRRGDEAQRSPTLRAQAAHAGALGRSQAFIRNNPTADLRVQTLAAQAHMSVRNFTRRFSTECGMPPAQYVRMVRTEHTRRLLATTDRGVDEVASACGFQTRQALRRALRAHENNS